MINTITYIKRKPSPHYHSIEGLFSTIKAEVNRCYKTDEVITRFSGGSPMTLIKNCLAFNKKRNNIYHITGDIHYLSLVTGKRTVLTIHDIRSAIHGSFLRRFYIKLFWFWLPAQCVKRITVISEFTKKELIKLIPFAANKIEVIYNPVNAQLKYHSKEFNTLLPKILVIGTKTNKNLERTFEALQGITCELLILGKLSENQLELLKKYSIQYSSKVNIPYNEVIQAYKDSDLVVFTSTYEGFGMPIIEAQAIGRPVITSNIGAMKEVALDTACLVDPYDVESIKNGIQKLIRDEAYRDLMIKKGLKNVERFSLETISNQYIALYKSIIN